MYFPEDIIYSVSNKVDLKLIKVDTPKNSKQILNVLHLIQISHQTKLTPRKKGRLINHESFKECCTTYFDFFKCHMSGMKFILRSFRKMYIIWKPCRPSFL